MKEKSFEKREELLRAALDEFSVKKYEEASLNSIIKKASISKGTFYYHFKDKQELYLFLLESSVKIKWEFINRNFIESEKEVKNDIFEKFKIQAGIGAEFAAAYPKYHNLSKMFAKERGNEIYDIAKNALSGDSVNPLNSMIEKAIDEGDFRSDIPREFIYKIINYMFSHFDEIFCDEGNSELKSIISNLNYYVDFIKNGLGRQ